MFNNDSDPNDLSVKDKQDLELEKRRWKNRRWLAWTSMISMVLVTVFLLLAPETSLSLERLKILSNGPLFWVYFAFTSIIGAYIGFSTWATMGKK